jgi:hypothetical protein
MWLARDHPCAPTYTIGNVKSIPTTRPELQHLGSIQAHSTRSCSQCVMTITCSWCVVSGSSARGFMRKGRSVCHIWSREEVSLGVKEVHGHLHETIAIKGAWISASTMTMWHHFHSTSDPDFPSLGLGQCNGIGCTHIPLRQHTNGRGSSPRLPAKKFFLGRRPTFFEAQKNTKKTDRCRTKRGPFFDTMRITPPIFPILRLISSGAGRSIVKLAIVRACRIAFDMPW